MALPINIDDLVNSKTIESVRIEFKKGWNPLAVLKTVCAFANDIDEFGAGYIIIGIEEQNGSPILPPFGIEQRDLDSIQKEFFSLCQNNLDPSIFPVIEPTQFMGKWLIIIWVTTGEQRPYRASEAFAKNAKMRIYVRHGSISKEADTQQEKRLRELASNKRFDDRVNTQASISDLDLGLILAYLQEIKSELFNEATKITFEELCRSMQIVRGPRELLRPLNVGLLLFNKEPEKFFTGGFTNLVEFEDEAGTKYSDKQFKGPVHIQIRQILEYLNLNIIKQFIRKDPHRSESDRFYNYPYQALEETVVNAIYHRGYDNPTPNEIRIYKTGADRRIEIHSYPGPMPPIDDQALAQLKITGRDYRNIRLGDFLKNLRLAEKYATGIPTIVNALIKNGSPKPILSTDAERSLFLVIIKIHHDTPEEYSQAIDESERILLSDIQQSILEQLLKEPSMEEELIQSFKDQIKEDLDYLISKDLINSKTIGTSRLLYVTAKGNEMLKSSF